MAAEPEDVERAQRAVATVAIDTAPLAVVFSEMYGDGYVVGTHAGIQTLPAGVTAVGPAWETAVDWDNWRPGTLGAAAQLAATDGGRGLARMLEEAGIVIRGIADTTRDQLATALAEGLSAGESRDSLTRRLRAVLGDATRAELIAQTESARAMTTAALDTYVDHGVGGVQWLASSGAEADCAALDGQVRPLPGGFDDPPPLHPRCFPAGTMVSAGDVVGSTERWYDGDLVEITTAGGHHLAATPNHPVFTPEGWVAAGALHESSHVVSSQWRQGESVGNPDDNEVPSRIEEVARSLGCSDGVAPASVPVAAEDFHGDGLGSEVCVVRTDGLLRNGGDPSLVEHGGQPAFSIGDVAGVPFAAERHTTPLLVGVGSSSGSMGGGGVASVLLGGAGSHAQAVGFSDTPPLDTSLSQSEADHASAHAEVIGDGLLALASAVASGDGGRVHWSSVVVTERDPALSDDAVDDLPRHSVGPSQFPHGFPAEVASDRVIAVRRTPFAGHVYNLQTASGWYIAEGIIVHNCRCALAPVLAEEMGGA